MSSEEKTPALQDAVEELASRIYVELVGRGFLRVENAAVIKPPPEALAKLSFELAEAFQKEVKEFRAASGPKNVGYDIQMSDMAGWDKK
jgi:hypothetical protein